MVVILALISVVIGAAGLLSLSQATAGVGLVAFGCLVGILARLVQAQKSTPAPAVAKTADQ